MCLAITNIWAQRGEISGKVYLNEVPVFGASIYNKETLKGVSTNTEGEFILKNLPLGKTILFVSYLGAKPQTKTVTITKDKKEINVYLESDAVLDEVVVSIPGSKLQKDLVVNVEKKKFTEINRESSLTIAQSITNLNGVSQNSTGTSIGKPVIRGLTSNRVITFSRGNKRTCIFIVWF